MKNPIDCEDLSLGKQGFTIWLVPIGIIFFSLISLTGFHILITKPKASLQDIVYLLIIINVFFGVSIWFSYQLLVGLKIIQEIKIKNCEIEVIFYFRRIRKLKFKDINSIQLLEKMAIYSVNTDASKQMNHA